MARPVAGPVVRSVAHKSWLEEIVTHRSGAPRSRGTAGQRCASSQARNSYWLSTGCMWPTYFSTDMLYTNTAGTQLLYVNAAGRASC
jgi:hypothetical protein